MCSVGQVLLKEAPGGIKVGHVAMSKGRSVDKKFILIY